MNTSVEERERIAGAADIRWLALTAEQRERRRRVAERTAVIQAGVKPPASGIFGREKAPRKAGDS